MITIPDSIVNYFNSLNDSTFKKGFTDIKKYNQENKRVIVKYSNNINRWPDKTFNKEFYSMACAITDLGLWGLLQEKDSKHYNNSKSPNYPKIKVLMNHKKVKSCGHSFFSSSYAYLGMVELAKLGFMKFCRLIKNKYYRKPRRNPSRLCKKIKY